MRKQTKRERPGTYVEGVGRFVIVDGVPMVAEESPWCDCPTPGSGFTQRSDGAWVRPCCMRRAEAAFKAYGDNAATPYVITAEPCPECKAESGQHHQAWCETGKW